MKQPTLTRHFLLPMVATLAAVQVAERTNLVGTVAGSLASAALGGMIGFRFALHVRRWLDLEPQQQVMSIPCPHCHATPRVDIKVQRSDAGKTFDGSITCDACGLQLRIEVAAPLTLPVAEVRDGGLRLLAERWANRRFRRVLAADWRRKLAE